MNITMTLEEYKDLKSRSISKEEWKERGYKLLAAAVDFSKRINNASAYSNLQDMTDVKNSAIEEFKASLREAFKYGEESL